MIRLQYFLLHKSLYSQYEHIRTYAFSSLVIVLKLTCFLFNSISLQNILIIKSLNARQNKNIVKNIMHQLLLKGLFSFFM